jgi:asparagine synthase (glutamine-hydrolysing)
LEEWQPVSLTPRPGFYLSIVQERQIIALAHELGATAVMGGGGGDAALCEHPDVAMARDYLHDHGVKLSLINAIVGTALITETSVWSVARATLGLAPRDRSASNIVEACLPFRKLLSAKAISLVSKSLWRFAAHVGDCKEELSPAKARHALVVSQPMMARSNVAGFDDPEFVDPLTGELVTETCMEIPVYIHCRKGQTRWLARDAFRYVVPAALLSRTTKGNPEPYVDLLRDENVTELEARLMDGELVRQGIVEPRTLQQALRGRPGAASATELLAAYGFELWASGIRTMRELATAA